MSRKRTMLKIGVTGGIGSGKSEVCRLFEKLGVPVLYADDIAKNLSNTDPGMQRAIWKLLGDGSYTRDGTLDRTYVASRIFSDKSLRRKMNDIVHPAVERVIAQTADDLQREGKRIVIVEAALIYEAGLDKTLDAVVVVDADEENRIARVMTRDGVGREPVVNRLNAQLDPVVKVNVADYVIFNNGTKEELEQRVAFLYSIFQNLAGYNP